jgi:saccharopine dehydrogenase-like NADP-dependent oxidoreductase
MVNGRKLIPIRIDHLRSGESLMGGMYYHSSYRWFVVEWKHAGELHEYNITIDAIRDNDGYELDLARQISESIYRGDGYSLRVEDLYSAIRNYNEAVK